MRAMRGLKIRAVREERRVALAERHELARAREHHRVEQRDAEERTRLSEALRDLAILAARARVARGVVVRHDHRAGANEDRGLEDLARVDERRRRGPDRDDLVRDRPMATVQVERHEVLARVVAHDPAQELDDLERPPDRGGDAGGATDVADRDLADEVDAFVLDAGHETLRVVLSPLWAGSLASTGEPAAAGWPEGGSGARGRGKGRDRSAAEGAVLCPQTPRWSLADGWETGRVIAA